MTGNELQILLFIFICPVRVDSSQHRVDALLSVQIENKVLSDRSKNEGNVLTHDIRLFRGIISATSRVAITAPGDLFPFPATLVTERCCARPRSIDCNEYAFCFHVTGRGFERIINTHPANKMDALGTVTIMKYEEKKLTLNVQTQKKS